MIPSSLELNSDDFPFFRLQISRSGSQEKLEKSLKIVIIIITERTRESGWWWLETIRIRREKGKRQIQWKSLNQHQRWADSVLTLSSTVIGVELHRLGASLTRRKDKYTSASPRCTCLPTRQTCIGVALGDPPQTPLQCWLVGRTSTPRLRLGVLASQLVNIALKLHSEENKYISAKLKFNSASPRWTSTWPRCTCSPPRATSAQGHLVQVQVQLGCASLNLDLDSVALSRVNAGSPRATSVKSISAKLKFNSASPRWTSTWPRWTWSESVVDHLVQLHSSSIRSSSSSTRLRLVELELDLIELETKSVKFNTNYRWT